jgi:hypothetical protein
MKKFLMAALLAGFVANAARASECAVVKSPDTVLATYNANSYAFAECTPNYPNLSSWWLSDNLNTLSQPRVQAFIVSADQMFTGGFANEYSLLSYVWENVYQRVMGIGVTIHQAIYNPGFRWQVNLICCK